MNNMPAPDVSVIIGAYEAMPYLTRCLESVAAQTLDAGRIEIVAVDDGSTDGTAECLDSFAADSAIPTRVLHQANSGGPSGPRNVGLGLARGRFVFFLDADDYLGPEALERLVAMADRAGTDVVAGKAEGVNRVAPRSMWTRTAERVNIYNSRIMYALSAQKLFRRELLVRRGMRFDETLRTGEDAVFTMEAFLCGKGVSVVADYTCYYLVGRDDGKHATQSGNHVDRFESAAALMKLITEHAQAGSKTEKLLVRPFTVTLVQQFKHQLLRESEEIRQQKMELAAPLMERYWTSGVAKRLRVADRLRLECVARGRLDVLMDVVRFMKADKVPEVVRRGRERTPYLAYPHFRSRKAGIPDAAYEVTVAERVGNERVEPSKGMAGRTSMARRVARRLRTRLRGVSASA